MMDAPQMDASRDGGRSSRSSSRAFLALWPYWLLPILVAIGMFLGLEVATPPAEAPFHYIQR